MYYTYPVFARWALRRPVFLLWKRRSPELPARSWRMCDA